jgi:REP element-mobilizing transposase RayT
MPKLIIAPVTSETYHVYNRGVDKRDIFLDKFDYLRFYQTLDLFNSRAPVTNFRLAKFQSSQRPKDAQKLVEIKAYALLPNHFHLLIMQVSENGISEFMRRVSLGYTSYFNEKNARSGSLFQGVFKRVHIETDSQYQYLFAYVNENHFVHNIYGQRELFHSSSIHYQGLMQSKLINDSIKNYELQENIKLAIDIHNKREKAKTDQNTLE